MEGASERMTAIIIFVVSIVFAFVVIKRSEDPQILINAGAAVLFAFLFICVALEVMRLCSCIM